MNRNTKGCQVPTIFDEGFLPSFLRNISLFDEESWTPVLRTQNTNVSLSEDENHVFIEAHLPGLAEKDIEVTEDKGVLWIRGEAKEEEGDKAKKYYYKASRSFSYRIAIPGNIDDKKQPTATYLNGVLKITYNKMAIEKPKKIQVSSK